MSRWNRPSSLGEYSPSGFPGGAEQIPAVADIRQRPCRAEASPGGRPEGSAGCAGGGVGGAECVSQAGEVNGEPGLPGHLVQERAHRFEGGQGFAADLLRGTQRIHRDQDFTAAVPREDGGTSLHGRGPGAGQ